MTGKPFLSPASPVNIPNCTLINSNTHTNATYIVSFLSKTKEMKKMKKRARKF